MKCQDCVEKNVHVQDRHVSKAGWVLVDYDYVRLLCQGCLDEYCYVFGELDLDFFDLEMDLEQAFKRISEVLEFRSKQYRRVLKENSELKEAQMSTPKEMIE